MPLLGEVLAPAPGCYRSSRTVVGAGPNCLFGQKNGKQGAASVQMQKHFLRKYGFLAILSLHFIVASPVFYGGLWLAEQMEGDPHLRVLGWVLKVILLLAAVAMIYVSYRMSYYMFVENYMFLDAFKVGWVGLWFSLAWLPIVGHLFDRERNPREAFEEEEKERHQVE